MKIVIFIILLHLLQHFFKTDLNGKTIQYYSIFGSNW
jgi:hypothetical protein